MGTKKEIQSVKNTIKQWTWYLGHPGCGKGDYFREKHLRQPKKHLCYLCDIWWDDGCYRCPLVINSQFCFSSEQAYKRWWQASISLADKGTGIRQWKKACKDIIKACEKWLSLEAEAD